MSIVLVLNPSEIVAGTRGSSISIRAIEIEALKKNDDLFRRTKVIEIPHRNNALYDRIKHPLAKRIDAFSEVFENVANTISVVLNENDFPLVIAGDHGSAAATIAGVKIANPESRIGVIWVDAHGDLHSPYTTPSGNIHGMPLAISLAEDNLENQQNDPDDETVKYWESLKNYGDISPKIHPQDIVFFGVRDVEEPEDDLMDKKNMRNFTVAEVKKKGVKKCVTAALEILKKCDKIYITFDVDSMDPAIVSKGTGTPVKKGFAPDEVLQIMKLIIASGKVVCLELVEVNPLLDNKGNEMARVAYLILKELIDSINLQISK